jgi:two-component system chemotaxis response regulator CheB
VPSLTYTIKPRSYPPIEEEASQLKFARGGNLMSMIRVLIVDDSILIREALSEVLRPDAGIEIVGTACSGEQALSLLPRLRPSLVTLDLAVPGMSGLATLTEIRKISPALPVILFSTFTEPCAGIKLDASPWGPTDYIQKQPGSEAAVS